MNAQPLTCPPLEQLRAFGLGEKLDPDVDASILEHLQSCETCASAVASISGDDFLARRRAAEQSHGTPTPDGSLGGLAKSITRPSDLPKPAPAPAPAEPIPPELANHPHYEVVRELGRGGMGVVYLVKNRLLDRLEALKVMATGHALRSGAAERFLQEIRSAAHFSHPNLVQAHSAQQVGDLMMLAMEFVPDGDLGTLVKERGPLPVVNACYYTMQVANGLQHASQKGLVHRDIKPSNLILVRDGKRHTVKITDFGLAKARKVNGDESGLTSAGQMMGTPHYMAPEQARDAAHVDIRADIYSLGCTLYFLLTGQTPFSGGPMEVLWKHREEAPRPIGELRPEVPAEVAAVVAKMMAKDPADRFQTPGEVAKAISPLLKREPRPEPAQAEVPTAKPSSTEAGPLAPMPLPPDRQDQWGDLTFSDGAAARTEAAPAPSAARRRPRWLWPAVVAGGLLIGFLAALGTGAIKFKTKDGVLVLEGLPADAEVVIDGEVVTVTRNGEEATITLNREGPHKLKVMQNGKEVYSSDLTIVLGGDPVRIRVERLLRKGQERIPSADDSKYEAELLRNPGCEEPPSDGKIPGWQVVTGGWQRQQASSTPKVFAHSGSWYFYAGECPKGELYQDVDVSAYATTIDGGKQEFAFLGYVRSYEQKDPDSSSVHIEYRGASPEADPIDVYRSGEQYSTAEWRLLADTRRAPPGTRTIRVVLVSTRTTRTGVRSNDGFFDDISLKALTPDDSPQRLPEDGFVPIFNGKDLSQWYVEVGDPGQWSVENETIVARSPTYKTRNYLLSTHEYADFSLRFDFMVEPGANGGAVIRAHQGERVPLFGQLSDDHPMIKVADPVQFPDFPSGTTHWLKDGRVDGKPVGDLNLPTGVWTSAEVTVTGNRCKAVLGGKQVVDVTLDPDPANHGGIDPALKRSKGRVGFQINTGTVRYRKIEISELGPDGKAKAARPRESTELKPGQPVVQVGDGTWRREGNELICAVQAKKLTGLYFGDEKWSDYVFTADVKFSAGSAPFTLVCRSPEEKRLYGFILGGPNSNEAGIFGRSEKVGPKELEKGATRQPRNQWLTVRVSVQNKVMDCSVAVAGQEYPIARFAHNDVLFPAGRVGLAVGATPNLVDGTVRIRNVRVTKPDGTVLWDGLPDLPGEPGAEGQPKTAAPAPAVPEARSALRFDGQKSSVRIPKSAFNFDGSHSLTIETVITPSACIAQHELLCNAAGGSGFSVKLSHDKGWTFAIPTGGGGPNIRVANPAPVVVGKRTVVAAVYDRAKNEIRLFIDGNLNGAVIGLGKHSPRKSPWETIIGANPQNGNKFAAFYAGTMEYFRVSKSARYAADYEPHPATETDADTLLLYLFRDGKGRELTDSSGRGGHGSISPGAEWVVVR